MKPNKKLKCLLLADTLIFMKPNEAIACTALPELCYIFPVTAAMAHLSHYSSFNSIGGFRAARLPGQATHAAEQLRVSVSNNHNWPEFYPSGHAPVWNRQCSIDLMYATNQGHIELFTV